MNEPQLVLVAELRRYRPADEREEEFRARILAHVAGTESWWHRDTLPGHVTASAFVTDPGLERLLLHHHRKLGRWLQLGGHDEGERSPAQTALREVFEESGLTRLRFFGGGPAIFDLDIHAIPAAGAMAAHDHLDVRYLLVADPAEELRRDAAESEDLRWFGLEEALRRMGEEGALRVGRKLLALRAELAG
ncbi:MAG: NUDIX domain-containing protein [Planctomycetota bacterium]|nr:MAG: NUDIX domain-containing protein [Planctomycetota bacterium]